MRVLFLSPRLCAPQVSGSRLREYHLARALGGHAEVTYVSFLPPGLEPPSRADLPFFNEIHVTPLSKRNSPLNVMRGLVGGWPLPVLNYTSAKMKATLASIVARRRFDLVHIDSFVMAAYAPFLGSILPGPVRVAYDWHNIGSELMRRMASSMSSMPRKIYARITASRLESMERRMLRSGFGHVVCSERDREQFIGVDPGARIAVIENGVEPERFAGAHPGGPRQRVLFVGTMNYSPNSEAAIQFARRAWPRIRERFPGLRLTIVGSNPGPSVLALRDEPGVEVTGTVPEVAPFYREALAAVVPLRTGGGTRLKILEAMAAGVPVISTSLGAEGLAVSPGKDILIVDDDEGWVRALNVLSESARSWDDLAAAGRDLVCSRYDWRVLGERLYETYREWLASMAEPSAAR
jgi:glycosyltransferase involved in cell wall biosynthesis